MVFHINMQNQATLLTTLQNMILRSILGTHEKTAKTFVVQNVPHDVGGIVDVSTAK